MILATHLHFDDRVAFEAFGVEIYWYGVFVALSFIVALFIMQWRARAVGLAPESMANLGFAAMVGGIVGARLFYVVLVEPGHFIEHPLEILNFRKGGLVYYGGFLGALGVTLAMVRLWRLPLPDVADIAAIALPAGQIFGRIGCLLNGCCFGRPTDGSFAALYPVGSAAWNMQAASGVAQPGVFRCAPVVPTQLYQAGTNALVCGLILFILLKHKARRGTLFPWYLILYGMGRFVNEFNRGDYPGDKYWRILGAQFTIAQVICLVVVPAGIAVLLYLRKYPPPPRPEPEPEAAASEPTEASGDGKGKKKHRKKKKKR